MITDKEHKNTDSGQMITDSEADRGEQGRFISKQLPFPYIDDLGRLSCSLRNKLEAIAQPAREKKRLNNEVMEQIILELCEGHFIPLSIIAELINRATQNVREKQLAPLIEKQEMRMAFPHFKQHKKQGYITSPKD